MGKILDALDDIRGNIASELYEEGPYIAVAAGCVFFVGSAIWACKKTLELPEKVEKAKKDIAEVKKTIPVEQKKEYNKAIAGAYGRAAVDIGKLYAGPVLVGGLAIASIAGGTVEIRNRNAALTATVSSLEAMYERYRKNVIDRYGKEVDMEMKYGVKHEVIKEKVVDEETGKKKTVEKEVLVMPDGNVFDDVSEYGRIFEVGATTYFDKQSQEANIIFLQQAERNANRLLRSKGYLFLNDVYEMLGFEPTEAGQRVGWIYDPKKDIVDGDYPGDNQVDFGIFPVSRPGAAEFINGFQPYVLLDFNVDGDIAKDGLFVKNHHFRNY